MTASFPLRAERGDASLLGLAGARHIPGSLPSGPFRRAGASPARHEPANREALLEPNPLGLTERALPLFAVRVDPLDLDLVRLDHRLQHPLGALIEGAAMLGRHQLARGAVEQPHVEMLFQFLDAVLRDGRRDAHVAPGGGKVAEFHHPHENRDIIEIGHAAPRRTISAQPIILPKFLKVIENYVPFGLQSLP